MKIIIRAPVYCTNERKYIYELIFGEFLGLSIEMIFEERESVEITCRENEKRRIEIDDR